MFFSLLYASAKKVGKAPFFDRKGTEKPPCGQYLKMMNLFVTLAYLGEIAYFCTVISKGE